MTKESIGIALKRHGVELDAMTVEKVFTRLGYQSDSKITLEQFSQLFAQEF